MSNEASRGRFQLVKDDVQNKISNNNGAVKCILTQSDSFVKDWEVIKKCSK